MTKALVICIVVGLGLLLTATIMLVVLNWNSKTYFPILSSLLIGITATFGAIFFPLKASVDKEEFSTAIIFDNQDSLPLFSNGVGQDSRRAERQSTFSSLSRTTSGQKESTKLVAKKPTNPDEIFVFCGELIQYQFVRDLERLHRGGWSTSQTKSQLNSKIYKPVKPTKMYKVPKEALEKLVSMNQFSRGDQQRFFLENGQLVLPKGCDLSLTFTPSSQAKGPNRHTINLVKKNYFEIEIAIQPMSGNSLIGIPSYLTISPEQAKHCQAIFFKISMVAKFEKITSGNWQTEEYKDWSKWLFESFIETYSD